MPVSVVIKALKLEGLWKYRCGYTECVCRVVALNSGRSIDLSTIWPIMFTGLYNTYSMSLTNYEQPLRTQHNWLIFMVTVIKHPTYKTMYLPLDCILGYYNCIFFFQKWNFVSWLSWRNTKRKRQIKVWLFPSLDHVQCVSIVPSQSQVLQTCEHVTTNSLYIFHWNRHFFNCLL